VLTRPWRPSDEFISFADGIRRILSSAVHAADKSDRARKKAFTIASRAPSALLARRWRDGDAAHIAAKLRRRFGMLFTFIRHRGVPWHNNRAENAIRPGVLHRKISGGRRTWTGAHELLHSY
jgi:transposase